MESNFIEWVGWLGAICFALCGLPQAIHTLKTKSARDFSMSFLLLWASGELLMILYNYEKLKDLPLMMNYLFNFLFLCPILYYKAKEFWDDHR